MASPNRRVLGEKNKNAMFDVQDPGLSSKGGRGDSEVRERSVSTIATRIGTKRRFHEIEPTSQPDSCEHVQLQQKTHAEAGNETSARYPVKEVDEVVDDASMPINGSHSTSASSKSVSASTNSLMGSFHVSQENYHPIEEQFEIVVEESQRTLEQIHATPMPEPKPSLFQPERPILIAEGSQESIRMSSFIDFDESDGSQREKLDDDMEMITPLKRACSDDATPQDQQLLEKATMLRTRLQLAMHKIETNQTSKPFSRLDKPKTMSPARNLPWMVFSAGDVPSSPRSPVGVRNSPESQIALRRAQAFRGASLSHAVQSLNSLPIPKILPTAYSAKYVEQRRAMGKSGRGAVRGLRSDTTVSSLDGSNQSQPTCTPSPRKAKKDHLPQTPVELLGSTPGSWHRGSGLTSRQPEDMSGAALTSSVVKGEAANGLLKLMRAASQ